MAAPIAIVGVPTALGGHLATAMPVVGFGPTGVTLANGDGPETAAAAAVLAEAAFGTA